MPPNVEVDTPLGGHVPLCSCGAALVAKPELHDPSRPGCAVAHLMPTESQWHPLTRRERFRLWAPLHEAAVLLNWFWFRDRLRCPTCKAVGTYKPHGSIVSRRVYGDIHVRRWLCKWCGYYIGLPGRVVAYPDLKGTGAWALPEPGVERQPTPAEVVRAEMGKAWPWIG